MDGNENSTPASGLDWLNDQHMFHGRGIRIARVLWRGNNVVIFLAGGRQVNFPRLSDLLSPRRVKVAFFDALGVVLPTMTARQWEPFAEAFGQAAREDAERRLKKAA
jgi:hypothetical protein